MKFDFSLIVGVSCLAISVASAQNQPIPEAVKAKTDALMEERAQLDASVWKDERLAQEYEQSLVNLWDALLGAERAGKRSNKFDIAAELAFESIDLGKPAASFKLSHAIASKTRSAGNILTTASWRSWLRIQQNLGFELVQSEWHHAKFTPATARTAAVSEVTIVLHLIQASTETRLAIDGPITVEWAKDRDESGDPVPHSVDASKLRLLSRQGKPAFEKWYTLAPSQPGKPAGVHPILLYDLDHDGQTEVVAAGCNQVLSLGKDRAFASKPFLSDWERFHETGLLADITGDGQVDFLAPNLKGDMVLFEGSAEGLLLSKGKGRSKNGGPLKQPTALTAGDIDLDGDLDVWVGQYRISYMLGVMPSPYHDANDGFPAYLLLNQGGGKFQPWTPEAGLDKKRKRRTYTGSFVDLDDDHDLDLMVVSDFAGVDLYRNDGKGVFSDITGTALDERRLFGMSATFADYNADGQLDFFVAGMGSTTARRLEHMKAKRTDDPEVDRMRMTMAYGNRMYVSQGEGSFQQPAFKDQVARTGWTWGTTSLDFDNDGDVDLFVANGHSSGESTKDHCTQFWCHDIYKPLMKPDRAMHELFQVTHKGYFDKTESWDGYQKSNLLMNDGGTGFTNVAFLMGVADQFDGRAALSDDIDGDGRMDLIVVEDQWQKGQVLHIYRNTLETDHDWIGVRFREEPGKPSPIGAKVLVYTDSKIYAAVISTGESIHGQHSMKRHVGIGAAGKVEAIEVVWPGGKRLRLEAPAIGCYHAISHP